MVAGVVVVGVLVGAAWLFSRPQEASPAEAIASPPAATAAPASPDTSSQDPCHEAVVLSVRTHSGVFARVAVQNTDGDEIPTVEASDDEGKFTTACARLENDDASGDASPQLLKVCKPGKFVVHIAGSGKGVFDLQAKPFPEVKHPGGPLLLCNYALDSDRVYDWVLKYQGGSKPAVFLLGSKGDPSVK